MEKNKKVWTCTHCGSTNIVWFEEKVIAYYYRLDENGYPLKTPYRKVSEIDGEACNYECLDCGAIGDGTGDVGVFEMREVKEEQEQ